jgi:hypothetical protein
MGDKLFVLRALFTWECCTHVFLAMISVAIPPWNRFIPQEAAGMVLNPILTIQVLPMGFPHMATREAGCRIVWKKVGPGLICSAAADPI